MRAPCSSRVLVIEESSFYILSRWSPICSGGLSSTLEYCRCEAHGGCCRRASTAQQQCQFHWPTDSICLQECVLIEVKKVEKEVPVSFLHLVLVSLFKRGTSLSLLLMLLFRTPGLDHLRKICISFKMIWQRQQRSCCNYLSSLNKYLKSRCLLGCILHALERVWFSELNGPYKGALTNA